MFAVIPLTSGAVTASWTARASGLAGGTGPPPVAAMAIAVPPAAITTTASRSARRRPVGRVRSRLMALTVRAELERSLTPRGGYARRVAEPAYYDEVFGDDGAPRPHYRGAMEALGAADLAELSEELRGEVRERGVRYGETGPGEFVVDAVPRLFGTEEWDALARGLSQRIRALDAFLRDAYGERRIVEAGRVPGRLIEDGAFYEPDIQGAELPVWAGFAGLDVVRGADGAMRVLEDNLRMPTGIGFAPLAWEIVGGVIGPAVPGRRPAEPEEALERFTALLRSLAPEGGDGDPSIVVLGDGLETRAGGDVSGGAFRGGVRLVPPGAPPPRGGRVCARAEGKRPPVDGIYRRSNHHLLRRPDG